MENFRHKVCIILSQTDKFNYRTFKVFIRIGISQFLIKVQFIVLVFDYYLMIPLDNFRDVSKEVGIKSQCMIQKLINLSKFNLFIRIQILKDLVP